MSNLQEVNERELQAWAALIAAFYERNHRDPNGPEHEAVLSTARQMAAAATGLQ